MQELRELQVLLFCRQKAVVHVSTRFPKQEPGKSVDNGLLYWRNMISKKCGRCGETKPIAEFTNSKNCKDGLYSYCKICNRKHVSDFKKTEKGELYYSDWVKSHPNYWRKPEIAEAARQAAHLRFINKPDVFREYVKTRRERIKINGGKYTQEEWNQLCEKLDLRCARCGEVKKLSPDHIIPVSKGGSSGIDNIQPLCDKCNRAKGTKSIDYLSCGEALMTIEAALQKEQQ